MSKERQRRRAEREAERERAAAEAARRDARAARRRARIARLTRLVPRRSGRPGGILARRRREQNAIVAVVFVLVQVIAWINLSSWTGRLGVLVLSAFLVPVFVTLAFDRRS
jgi:Flp pilus assembly protein TadB